MAVPADIQPIVGKVEWTNSLGKTDPVAAAAKRGELVAFYKNEVLRLRGQLAKSLWRTRFTCWIAAWSDSQRYAATDKVIAEQLAPLASTVVNSWATDRLGEPQTWDSLTVREAPGRA